MPHRAPGSPGLSRKPFLSGKPIKYYRPTGSPQIKHLIDEGFQAFNAGRLSEACQIFSEKMLAPDNDTTIGLTVAGALTPAGLGGCVIELMDRGLVDFVISHRREPLPRPALRAELHAAARLAVPERRRALRGRRHPHLRRPVSRDGAARDRRVHPRLPRSLRPERADRHLRVPLPPRPAICSRSFPAARSIRSSRARRWPACRIYTSSPGDSSIGMNIAYHELMNGSRLHDRSRTRTSTKSARSCSPASRTAA